MSIFSKLFKNNKSNTETNTNSQEDNTMKIAVVAANGKVGQLVVNEAQDRGFDVTAVVRGENKTSAKNAIVKDALTLTTEDLKDFDVVVSAAGGWTAETVGAIPAVTKKLIDILSGTDVRLVVVGGAGSLFVNPEHTLTVADGPDFPADWLPIANAHSEALQALRDSKDLKWTYISPAADFQADGPRTGEYKQAGEEFTLSSNNDSVISYADYAIALVDEVEKAEHVGERISVVNK